jgi:hypothetical protein
MSETSSIELKRHYQEISPKEFEEVVGTVADLIVDFLKKKRSPEQPDKEVPV